MQSRRVGARRQRARGRAAEQGDELTPLHSIELHPTLKGPRPPLEHFPEKACPGLDPGWVRFSAENATT
jgi:hypothetical protein